MDPNLTAIDPIWWIALGVVVVLLIGLLVWSGRRRAHRTERLKRQFRSEYDRTASSANRKDTEEDLELRTARRSSVHLADLNESDADDLEHPVDELLRSFVDAPQGAALGMTQLVGRIAAARGYITTEGSVLDLVSVDHPEQVAAMRRSEADMEKAKGADLTEASRLTVLNARVLAERLLAEGRAGHVDDDLPDDATETPLAAETDGDTETILTSEEPVTESPQMWTPAGASTRH